MDRVQITRIQYQPKAYVISAVPQIDVCSTYNRRRSWGGERRRRKRLTAPKVVALMYLSVKLPIKAHAEGVKSAVFHRESCRWICTSRGGLLRGRVCTIRAVWDPVDRIGELPCISGVHARTSEKCQCASACSRSFHAGMGGILRFAISPTRSGRPLTRVDTLCTGR